VSAGIERRLPAGGVVADYGPVVIYLALILAFAGVSLGVARLLRPRRPTAAKRESYECGAQPVGDAWIQFPVGFYLVALVFIVFDALAIFLFPWALTLRDLGFRGVGVMVLFLAILLLGWVYAYRERMLEWQ
jgi:NADH-quinone oxidoreductase subunit A